MNKNYVKRKHIFRFDKHWFDDLTFKIRQISLHTITSCVNEMIHLIQFSVS